MGMQNAAWNAIEFGTPGLEKSIPMILSHLGDTLRVCSPEIQCFFFLRKAIVSGRRVNIVHTTCDKLQRTHPNEV